MKQFNRIKIEIILQYFIELIFASRNTDEANTMHNTAKSKNKLSFQNGMFGTYGTNFSEIK